MLDEGARGFSRYPGCVCGKELELHFRSCGKYTHVPDGNRSDINHDSALVREVRDLLLAPSS